MNAATVPEFFFSEDVLLVPVYRIGRRWGWLLELCAEPADVGFMKRET